ncbi:hypothetical protein MED01_006820 [Micromonospora sp. MED01]|uniref:tetratricopeptide repeat protein n=1 Tax=Micromonospora alfalfae TaxID=2911212 RepID=UPI001EE8E8E2|nr:hypothetical protein [Micromonospora alfalfae]MCG5461947.1 hypothetical protein [Micromonospora alfalfae]
MLPRDEQSAAGGRRGQAGPVKVSGTGGAQAQTGAVANSGIVYGDVQVGMQPVPRSGYGEQIRRIVPEVLVGREAELRELAAFCTADAGDPYIWWRAGAWAGKTALMSWFALHPPPGVRVVPFFVTARFAAQNDRVAFTDVVLEQLGELLREGPAPFLTASTRETHLLRLLNDAAHRCQRRGERLVLLVDGLDEDRGVTTGPDAYSIAALLPARPPAGLRVIVAGRPHPPIPADVPAHHPLRDPDIVRPLDRSAFAQVIRTEAQRELKHLLASSGPERELLSLLTASGGGLGTAELAELTDLNPYEVEEILRSRAGRTFRPRESHSRPGELPVVFVLGHEELREHAVRMLGPKILSVYRDRIHTWADAYAAARWAPGTPEYLLRGYFSLLLSTGDVSRMAVLAADSARHDRMRDLTGGDSAALTEIRSVQHTLSEANTPDLTALFRLAVRRDALHERNECVPASLPAVWVELGQPRRAEALARSLSQPRQRAEALIAAAQALAGTGAQEDAEAVLAEAAENARAERDPQDRVRGLVDVGRAWWPVGHQGAEAALREAEAQAAALVVPSEQSEALVTVAEGWQETGNLDRAGTAVWAAIELARNELSFAEEWRRVDVLARAERVLHALKDTEHAHPGWPQTQTRTLVGDGELLSESAFPLHVAWVLRDRPEQRGRVGDLLAKAEAVARSAAAEEESEPDSTLLRIGIVLSAAGFTERAEDIARDIREKDQLLAFVSKDLARLGKTAQAEALARSIGDAYHRVAALGSVAKALTVEGRHPEAFSLAVEIEALAHDTVDPLRDAWQLIDLADALAKAGRRDRALSLLGQAEVLIGAQIANPHAERAGHRLGGALVSAGAPGRAEAVARGLTDPLWRVRILTAVGQSAATGTDRSRALPVLQEAAEIAAALTDPTHRAYELNDIAVALATAGAGKQAESLALSIEFPGEYGNPALDRVGRELGTQGQHTRGTSILVQCETEARGLKDIGRRAWRLTLVAEGFAACGHPERAALLLVEAEAEGRRLSDPTDRVDCLIEVGEAFMACGDRSRARLLLTEAAESGRALPSRHSRSRALFLAGMASVSAGAHREAEELVPEIDGPALQGRVLTALAQAVPPQWARRLVAQCLSSSPWRHALDGLAATSPSALAAVADETYGRAEGDAATPEAGRKAGE